MSKISKLHTFFLKNLAQEGKISYSIVPRNRSCGKPGDILVFQYKPKNTNIIQNRALLITKPVIKNTKSGGVLITGLTVRLDMDTFDIKRLKAASYLYKRRKELKDQQEPDEELKAKSGFKNLELYKRYERMYLKDKFRTFLSNNIQGALYRVRVLI